MLESERRKEMKVAHDIDSGEESDNESQILTPLPLPGHLSWMESLRRRNQEMEEELQQRRRQLGDIEEWAKVTPIAWFNV